MAEVIVISDRKSIFTKLKFIAFVLVLAHAPIASHCENLENPNYSTSLKESLSSQELIEKKSDDNNNDKFSSVILQPVQGTLEDSSKPAESRSTNVPSSPIVSFLEQLSAKTASSLSAQQQEQPGGSLWSTIRQNFLQPKDQIPKVSQNSVLSVPKLKSPRQAWEDLVANAKTGFKESYSPFEYTTTTSTTTPRPVDVLSGEPPRSTRDAALPWHTDTTNLAWDTMKLMGSIGKDLLTGIYPAKEAAQPPKVSAYFSPLQFSLARPFIDAYNFKIGILEIYQRKLRDLAYANFLLKDNKVHYVRDLLFKPITGWGQIKTAEVPSAGIGWTAPQGIVVVDPIKSDALIIKRWIKAKLLLKKHLLLAKWRIKKELLFEFLPTFLKIKLNFVKAFLTLLAHKDKFAFIEALKILNHAIWKGKKKFLYVALNLKDFKEDLIRDHLSYVHGPYFLPYGHGTGYEENYHPEPESEHPPPQSYHSQIHSDPLYSYPSSSYKTIPEQSYGKLKYSVPSPTEPPYHPPAQSYGAPAHPQPTYGPPQTTYAVSQQPQQPHPTYGAPIQPYQQQQNYQQQYKPLPPVVNSNPGPVVHNTMKTYATLSTVNAYPQVSSSSNPTSEESREQPSFFSKLVQSVMAPSAATNEQSSSSSSQNAKGSRFSLQLLNSGFAHN